LIYPRKCETIGKEQTKKHTYSSTYKEKEEKGKQELQQIVNTIPSKENLKIVRARR
jgi:hypothetical protein